MLANLTQDNWIALHQAAASVLPEGRYFDVSSEDGRIVLTPVCLADTEAAREWVPAFVETAHRWLAEADREFDDERDLVASRCLWEAVRAAITAVSVKRGAPVETDLDMAALVTALDQEYGPDYTLLTEFGVARLFKRNAEEIDNYRDGPWDACEFDTGRPAVKRLVERLAAIASD